jgi:hypothetical protein
MESLPTPTSSQANHKDRSWGFSLASQGQYKLPAVELQSIGSSWTTFSCLGAQAPKLTNSNHKLEGEPSPYRSESLAH